VPSRATTSWLRARMRILERVTRDSAAVIGLSAAARDALWRWWGVEARLIYPGVDLSAFAPGARERDAGPTIACGAPPDDARHAGRRAGRGGARRDPRPRRHRQPVRRFRARRSGARTARRARAGRGRAHRRALPLTRRRLHQRALRDRARAPLRGAARPMIRPA